MVNADLGETQERAGPLHAHLGIRPQVDDMPQLELSDQPRDVASAEPLKVVGSQDPPEPRGRTVGGGETSEVSHIDSTVENYPTLFVVHHLREYPEVCDGRVIPR
ncbi:hypothetical protein Pth03_75330 [Planotetraspora thailandica]|uniref:Uncharacterized protein n=1 Tax=Planotetraspora thailandica TaxID=487172 RepID=A0A8J4DEB9_9ACTN|nr:hypothetical protein Pth03_75330 [Planotetraspora thailandica]